MHGDQQVAVAETPQALLQWPEVDGKKLTKRWIRRPVAAQVPNRLTTRREMMKTSTSALPRDLQKVNEDDASRRTYSIDLERPAQRGTGGLPDPVRK